MPIAIRRVLAIALAVAILCSGAALAEEAANSGLEEIVVTAQKRSERLQDVPLAVTVVGETQLQAQHIYTISDLARTAPSLEMVQAFGGPGGGGQIRGVGTNSFTRSAEGAVGMVVDGVPQGNVQGNDLFDLARVEVLRGPQGTLFGLTSSAGVINVTTAAPDPSGFHANVHVDYSGKGTLGSRFGEQTVRGAINIPLTDNTALRIAASGDFVKGVQRNAYNGEENQSHDGAVRARYLWKGDRLTLNLIADYDHVTRNYSDPQFVYVNVAAGSGLATQLATCGITASWSNQDRCYSGKTYSGRKNTGLSAQLDWDMGFATLTAVTGYRKDEQPPQTDDIMGNPQEFVQIWHQDAIAAGRQVSQELRIASPAGVATEYTTGLFYSDYKATSGYAPGGGFHVGSYQVAPVFVQFFGDDSGTETTNRAFAVFGQATHHVNERLGLIAGLRYTSQKLTDSQSANTVVGAPALAGGTDETNMSGKLGLQYKFAPDLNTYATWTRGYKGPQIIPSTVGNPPSKIKAEIPTAYELGLKGSTAGGRLSYDLSAFYTDVENYQGQRCVLAPSGALDCAGESIPHVKSKGVELELYGKPVQGLWLNAGIAYDDVKFPAGWTGFNPEDLRPAVAGGVPTDLGNQQMVNVPKTKFTLAGEYSHALGAIQGYFGGDTVYKSEMRMGYSGDSRFVYPAHWSLGARLGVRSPDQKWSVELFGRNLTNEHEPVTLFGGPSFVPPGAIPVPVLGNGFVNGISGWVTQSGLRQIGLSVEARW